MSLTACNDEVIVDRVNFWVSLFCSARTHTVVAYSDNYN